jgi:quercetin 2,3-dioxygenase
VSAIGGQLCQGVLKNVASQPGRLAPGRRAYLVAARGAVEVNGVTLGERDGTAIANEPLLRFTAVEDAEIVLVDVG